MAQINLLKQNNKTENFSGALATGLARALIVVVVGLVGYYGWLFYQKESLSKQVSQTEQDIQNATKDLANVSGKQELLTRQAQLKEITPIIQKHPYWSGLFPALAKATLKTASYVSMSALQDGNMTLHVDVPSMVELDKFLQVFDDPVFYQNFSNVRIGGMGNTEKNGKIVYEFEVKFQFNTDLLKYQQSKTQP